MMGAFEFLSNDRLVDEVERGLRKGYWDKALIPELKKRLKKEELLEQLYSVCKEYKHTSIGLSNDSKFINTMNDIEEIENETTNK